MNRIVKKDGLDVEEFGDTALIGGITGMAHSSRLWLTNLRDRLLLGSPVPVRPNKLGQHRPLRLRPVLPPVRLQHNEFMNPGYFPRGMLSGRSTSQGHRLPCSHKYQGQMLSQPLWVSGRGVYLFLENGPRRSYAAILEGKVVNDRSAVPEGYRIGRKESGSRHGLCSTRRTRSHVNVQDSNGVNLLRQARVVWFYLAESLGDRKPLDRTGSALSMMTMLYLEEG